MEAFPQSSPALEDGIAVFFEANNPAKNMTFEEIAEDYDNAGLDTYRRYSAWLRFARPLQFDYVQPALDHTKKPVLFLDLFYMGKGDAVSAAMLRRHLYSFVSISVLKGRDADRNPEFSAMSMQLRQFSQIPLIPLQDPDIVDIQREAKWRASAVADARRQEDETKTSPPMPTARERRLWLPPRMGNAIYRIAYRLYHQLERYHIAVSYVEFVVGSLGIVVAAWLDWLASTIGIPGYEAWHHDVERSILGFLSLYIVTRGIVRMRRSRLGYHFNSLSKRLRKLDSGSAGDVEAAADWLRHELATRLEQRTAFGPMIRADMPADERMRIQRRIASYSAQIYSDRVWGIVDRTWQEWEMKELSQWLKMFPDGLMGATFDKCAGRTFFSVLLPIQAQAGRLVRVDLRRLELDEHVVRALTKQPGSLFGSAGRGAAPCLLVLRLLVSGRPAKAPRISELELQLGLILTGLLHVALTLEKLAHDGDLSGTLPPDTSILVVATNRQSMRLLKWFGFKLLQRAASHEGTEEADAPGESNLSIFRLIIGRPNDRAPEVQRFVELLADLLGRFYQPHRSTSPRVAHT
jgi:hypothetical protein